VYACVDVGYEDDAVVTACLTFDAWTDERAREERVARAKVTAAPYVPGEFYKRELPFLVAALRPLALELAIVDGYVHLADRPGLGAHLYEALARRVPIVGVAKRPYRGAPALPVTRGRSARPLFVSAIGVGVGDAADRIRAMHGAHRIPTLLKRADTLCSSRDASAPSIRRA
jgi:deoxyribonuclease V